MTDTVYRFLPWARRGLAAALPGEQVVGAALPQRSRVELQVTVEGEGAGSVSAGAMLYGPGDVVGLDPSVVVRTTPRPFATSVEPNYLVSVDFDAPELPWLFTPSGPGADGRLRPWLVLVVVRDRPEVRLTMPRGAPLPQLHIESGAVGDLPDLAESWAWAHAQFLDADTAAATAPAVGEALREHPDRNVSRLVCPRRLDANARWIACVVPAFDAGVVRGMGADPRPDVPLAPAWTPDTDSVTLPVYHHWEFATGPAGDFESLARRIKPHRAAIDIGTIPMHIGDADPSVRLPAGDAGRILAMDGALRAPEPPGVQRSEATLDDVPPSVVSDLATMLRTLTDSASGAGAAGGRQDTVGPPLYGGLHARRETADGPESSVPLWLRELNLDPRGRVAGGLGAEILRANQEEIMHAAWQQVGNVLDAEAALSRARLAFEASASFHRRHLATLPPDRLLELTAPLTGRVRMGGTTVSAAIRPTSMPKGSVDAAMRRLTSPSGPVMRKAARRLQVAPGTVLTPGLVATYARGTPVVDPTLFPRPAIRGFGSASPADLGDGTADLGPVGLPLAVPADLAAEMAGHSVHLAAAAGRGPQRLALRADLRKVGLVTEGHLRAARDLVDLAVAARPAEAAAPTAQLLLGQASSRMVGDLVDVAAEHPGAAAFLLSLGDDARAADALDVGADGRLSVRTAAGLPNLPIARFDRGFGGSVPPGQLIGRLPAGTFAPVRGGGDARAAGEGIVLRPGLGAGEVVASRPQAAGDGTNRRTVTTDRLLADAAAVARFEAAVAQLAVSTGLTTPGPTQHLVSFDLTAAATAVLARCRPSVSHPERLDATVELAGVPVGDIASGRTPRPGWFVPPLFDRVITYPVLDTPAVEYLAAYDKARCCPGLETVPTDSVTLLESNPRFIAAYMAGVNHEANRELLWRRYPTDRRGSPFRHFWQRLDGKQDVRELHTWSNTDLAHQTSDPDGNLVLLLRGELLRRYPNTIVVAIPAVGPDQPSADPAAVVPALFAGHFEPDVSYFGFPLTSRSLKEGHGWYFALMEPLTEPRFGLDESPVPPRTAGPGSWDATAWTDLPALRPGGHVTVPLLDGLGLGQPLRQSDGVAAALFQRPFELLVHAKYLTPEGN